MTRVLILGGGGMVGQKLLGKLLAQGLGDGAGLEISLHDLGFPPGAVEGVRYVTGSITDEERIGSLIAERPDVIFHLASIVSGEAETDFDKGWAVNMFPMWTLLSAIRAEHEASRGGYCPRVVFTSSIAVFGGPYPDKIGDEFLCAPQTSYGAQKLVCETMLSDFSRKGFLDGISIRLPTICVRPGKPNKAASGFFSGIIREPLNGQRAVLPVADTVRHWHASPRSAAEFLTQAALLDTAALAGRRALNMPGVSCTVAEQIEALREVAGDSAVARIEYRPDPAIEAIVAGWPRDFQPDRAIALGFRAETSFREIVDIYIADELG